MALKPYVKYDVFGEDLGKGVHHMHAAGDAINLILSNIAPTPATDAVLADAAEIAAGNGYTAGGADTQNDLTRAGGVTTITGVDVTWTASGGQIGPFRYVIAVNATAAGNPLIAYWDKGSEVTLEDGESFTHDFENGEIVDWQ